MKVLQYLIFILFCALLALTIYYSRKKDGPGGENSAPQKVIMLGVDGLTERVISRLLQQNKLPDIKVLRKSGSYGRITSIDPIFSPSIWTSIATGKKREEHGIEHFQIKGDDGQMTVTNSSHRKSKALWNIFSEHNMRSGLLGFFNTWPVEEINGFMVSDISVFPLERSSHPPQTRQTMKEVLAPYINFDLNRLNEFAKWPYEEQFKYFTPEMFKLLDRLGSELINNYMKLKNRRIYSKVESEQYSEFFKHNEIIEQVVYFSYFEDFIRFEYAKRMYHKDLDFFFLYLKGTDTVSHTSWHYYEPGPASPPAEVAAYKDIIPNYYSFADRVLGYFLAAADENTTVILISDHGFEKKRALFFNINKLLNIMGYLDYEKDGQIKRDKIYDDRMDWERFVEFRRLHVHLDKLYPGRDPARDELKMKQITDDLAAVRVGDLKLFERINYYPGSHSSLPLIKKSKFPPGPSPEASASSGLYAIEAFVNGIFYTPEIQNDYRFLEKTITIKGRPYPLKKFFEHVNIGWHSLSDGVIHFLGPSIKPDYLIKGLNVLDVAPAILKILKLPVGADMAGGVPIGIFKPEFLMENPTTFIKSYDDANRPLPKTTPGKSPVEHKTEKQLRALGYIQ